MNTLPGKWGGIRRNSGRPRGGVRDSRRQIHTAIIQQGVEGCAQVVRDLVLAGRGDEVLKIWCGTLSVYEETKAQKARDKKADSILAEALTLPLLLD